MVNFFQEIRDKTITNESRFHGYNVDLKYLQNEQYLKINMTRFLFLILQVK